MPSENINWGEANDPTLSDWTDVDFRGRSATDDFWEFVFHSSTALVPADHFNGWLKWFAWICPSMAPKIMIWAYIKIPQKYNYSLFIIL